jgi:hypothetical protein
MTTLESEQIRAQIRSGQITPGRRGSAEQQQYDWAVERVYAIERAVEARDSTISNLDRPALDPELP